MFIQGEQGREAIGLAIMSTTASYLFSMIYIMPNFKPLTSCLVSGKHQQQKWRRAEAQKKTKFAGTFHWVKEKKNKIGQTISIKFTLALHLYPELCVCLSM